MTIITTRSVKMKHYRKFSSILSFLLMAALLLAANGAESSAKTNPNKKLHGGIEIGSRGVKATAIRFDRKRASYDVNILYTDVINTNIMRVKDNRFTPEAVKETAEAVQKFFARLQSEHQIAPEQIYIVGSSGLRAENKNDLVEEVRKLTGKTMSFLSVEMEVQLSIAGTIPQQRDDLLVQNERAAAMLIDIGSGNTKGGYLQPVASPSNGTVVNDFVTMSIPMGTQTFTNEASRNLNNENDLRTFALNAVVLSPAMLNASLRKEIEKKPGLLNRERVYLSGGIAWAMATLLYPANRRSFVQLTAADIDLFQYRLRDDPNSLLNPKLTEISDPLRRIEAAKEIESVKAVFTPKNLIAGAEILKAVSTEFNLEKRKIWFARFGNLSWILSYVRGQAEKQILAAAPAR
jgi:hypothetical protein